MVRKSQTPSDGAESRTSGDISNSGMTLLSFVERVERLEEEQKALAEDKKEVYGEIKAVGFDAKIIRSLIRLRKMDNATRQENEALMDLYSETIAKAERQKMKDSEAAAS